ncbi:hypothetical protein HK099_004703 [Clydaea vesicula]|uniref:Glutamine amidotransferase domain-containing protein n=1 Tax=Clydaea vesicula TaxID=447962 RepID=A0AAD5U9Q4_9FUNG|nr:hypothetical protein HK099_004703 [Clydaea vesicula]
MINKKDDFKVAKKIIFPGVGAFGPAMERLKQLGFFDLLKDFINSGKPFMGICVGMQFLCEGSEESDGVKGLGLIPASCTRFKADTKAVPHMGWNIAANGSPDSATYINHNKNDTKYYFVHSYGILYNEKSNSNLKEWIYSLTTYKNETFVSSVRKGNVFATQFHPEKSGWAGLKVLKSFLETDVLQGPEFIHFAPLCAFTNRIIACLDVRENDDGDLVVTKGDQYDVREKTETGSIRNMGKPVSLAQQYFNDGADEITFLNITSFRSMPLHDLPMLEVLKKTSEEVFVPLTIGGGIRDLKNPSGDLIPAIDVAREYFRSGADKVSIGSDAVFAAEEFLKSGKVLTGTSSIEQISKVYGNQAVVVSVDPRRVYVSSPIPNHTCIETQFPGPRGEKFCWYQCTVKGGRETRDVDVVQLTQSCEILGCGEILLNCMDKDGTNSGFDLELIKLVKSSVNIPVIASSGAGRVEDFHFAFLEGVEAALAAGIFHRKEVPIFNVKKYLKDLGYSVRFDFD